MIDGKALVKEEVKDLQVEVKLNNEGIVEIGACLETKISDELITDDPQKLEIISTIWESILYTTFLPKFFSELGLCDRRRLSVRLIDSIYSEVGESMRLLEEAHQTKYNEVAYDEKTDYPSRIHQFHVKYQMCPKANLQNYRELLVKDLRNIKAIAARTVIAVLADIQDGEPKYTVKCA